MATFVLFLRVLFLLRLSLPVTALGYDSEQAQWNLNQNELATHPNDYWGEWENHTYHPSPASWRFPFYALTIDRYVDGDPSNNEANGTVFEHNWMSNQFRFGGDTRGLMNDLDYIQGMGIKGIYITGSPFINMPWSGDGYGPLDFTLLDRHHGTIKDWRAMVAEIHRRGLYVILDNTMATMGDLLAMKGYVNTSVPFSWQEHDYLWKTDRRYHDFHPGNNHNNSCKYPRMWGQNGYPLDASITDQMDGCRASEFDQYGDIKGTGAYPAWRNQLSKFASVQDRLREWNEEAFEKIRLMSCMQISMLDIDGFRMDKGLQTTPDAMADFASAMRECARRVGKDNFLMNGEIVGDPRLAAVYVGRGKQPNQKVENMTEAELATNETDPSSFIRPFGHSALDGSAFHYDIYGAMTRFLGLDGPWGAYGVDWVSWWQRTVREHDMVNANTGKYDPRHMIGMTNQDVFRWPALSHGVQRQLLGWLITVLEFPGIPIFLFGEEQAHYVLENLADDYVFGRTPMSASRAWQLHGCYKSSETVYVNIPFESAKYGCEDDSVSLDHRDASHPVRNVLKRMFELRRHYPVLNDGFDLQTLSTKIYNIYLPGSGGLPSPHGIWSVYRGRTEGVQDFSGEAQGNQGVWFVYQNENRTIDYDFDCRNPNISATLISAFPANTTVKNLFYPYEEYVLEESVIKYGIENSDQFNGCIPKLRMLPWGWKALVPKEKWLEPSPTITRFLPGHDARLRSTVALQEQESVPIQLRFSSEMSCDSVTKSLKIESTTQDGQEAVLNKSSIICEAVVADLPRHVGEIATAWIYSAQLENVSNGVHRITVDNATTLDGSLYTGAVDRFSFRIGQADNPMVFPSTANYTKNLLHKDPATGSLYMTPRAAGADKWRYSLNWGSTYSDWSDYTGDRFNLTAQPWSGTKLQEWTGDHVIVHYWSAITGSSDHVQHADLDDYSLPPRRWPHAFVEGSWNQYGYDSGIANEMKLDTDGFWNFKWIADWPTQVLVNVWGMNPDGAPDKTQALGDVDGDGVLDWVPPDSLASNVIEITNVPPRGYLGWQISVNDGDYRYYMRPAGSATAQLVVALFIGLTPILTGILGVWAFKWAFYQVKVNEIGLDEKQGALGAVVQQSGLYWAALEALARGPKKSIDTEVSRTPVGISASTTPAEVATTSAEVSTTLALVADPTSPEVPPASALDGYINTWLPVRRTALIATLEYEIEDWKIKIRIGGLGVMSSLMGKHLVHQNLIWVVPCLNEIVYPIDRVAEDMVVVVLGQKYSISVQYHTFGNVTYVLLDAPVFRKRTKAEPYPPRMDDLESAIYYSVWNQCIAQALTRFEVDLYHINDYHGTVAPLHLLPKTVPCCLSLHNAEFQGMWSLKSNADMDEICQVFNLPKKIVKDYVQFGEVFNLLHAGASILRLNQKGFGSVGVSKKYGKRAHARYPIFWGLTNIGALPNPDPSDFAAWDKLMARRDHFVIDRSMEANRGNLRIEAQEWAGLTKDPEAELFVFVGRWSQQKGVDLIADVFFSILTEYPRTQLICIGPVIDLYGKFAALKLEKLTLLFPGRVCSKPVFTQLPPCIFSGAEFALIPSRDEPFGLVAVEFGRKGALGVGSRVGGLGQMPGWWFTVESDTTKHMIRQFKLAIRAALASKRETRAMMRARSLFQRFPVAQWMEELEVLQSTSIKMHNEQKHEASTMTALKAMKSGAARLSALATNPFRLSQSTTAESDGSNASRDLNIREDSPSSEIPGPPSPSEAEMNSSAGPHVAFAPDLHDIRTQLPQMSETTVDHGENGDEDDEDDEDDDEQKPEQEPQSPEALSYEISGSPTDPSFPDPVRSISTRSSTRISLQDIVTSTTSRGSNDVPVPNLLTATLSRTLSDSPFTNNLALTTSKSAAKRLSAAAHLFLTEGPNSPLHESIASRPAAARTAAAALYHESLHPISLPSATSTSSGSLSPSASTSGTTTPTTDARPALALSQSWIDNYEPSEIAMATPDAAIIAPDGRRNSSFGISMRERRLSIAAIVGRRNDFKLQKVEPFFTDSTVFYYNVFDQMLDNLDAQSSEYQLCIENFLVKSERQWFGRFHRAKLGQSATMSESSISSTGSNTRHNSSTGQVDQDRDFNLRQPLTLLLSNEFNIEEGFVPPKGLKKLLQMKIGDWQLYCILLAFGQIIAANSYQITLLTGARGQAADKLYIIASIYLASTLFWWYIYRRCQAVYVLSCPFALYGIAFFTVGMAPFTGNLFARGWMYNIATGFYAVAAASGSFFFALNFGTEGGTPSTFWIFRACVIQGTQEIYVSMLWYWGNSLTETSTNAATALSTTSSKIAAAITTPIAVLMWLVGCLIYFGLPNYYRQQPGSVPSFYISIFRRKVVLWFLVMVLLQNYWLSAQYGRNWSYLWSDSHAPAWSIALLIVIFFVFVWALILWVLGILSTQHSWIMPVFAISLGAPRWAQMLWGVSGIALYVPWGSRVMGALLGRSLWLWLGVLDAVQGVGFGMLLLQTLARFHFLFALVAGQVLGSVATILARATAPNRIGPGAVFPNLALGWEGVKNQWFWLCVVSQLVIVAGYFKFFRKEQLFKP